MLTVYQRESLKQIAKLMKEHNGSKERYAIIVDLFENVLDLFLFNDNSYMNP